MGYTNQSLTTQGCTVVTDLALQPSLAQKWTILSVGFQATLFVSADVAIFGRLAPIYGGVFLEGGRSSGKVMLPPIALPDPSLTVKLWDPANDPYPPAWPSAAGSGANPPDGDGLQISGVVQLPIPYPIRSGSMPPSVGFWIMQSLLGSPAVVNSAPQWTLVVVNPSYTVELDDGLD